MLILETKGAPVFSISSFPSHNIPEAASQMRNAADRNSVRPSYTQQDPTLSDGRSQHLFCFNFFATYFTSIISWHLDNYYYHQDIEAQRG